MAPGSESRLSELIAEELGREAPPAARTLAEAICERHGETVAAILFYGSCLRKNTSEGVLDFYVVVDRYRDAYTRPWLGWMNALLPPNVFYLERESAEGAVRTKYAVISAKDFTHCVSARCIHPYIWARFAQPVLLAHVRDEEARARAIRDVSEAVVTFVRRLAVFLPAHGRTQRFSLGAFWQQAFRRTYGSEVRTESEETIRSVYEDAPARYDEAGGAALEILRERSFIEAVHPRPRGVEVEMRPMRRLLGRWRWQLARPISKVIAFLRLMKTAGTFGDWLPYALWKLERHTAVRVDLTPRQRSHPLIFGWPVIFRLLMRRSLH